MTLWLFQRKHCKKSFVVFSWEWLGKQFFADMNSQLVLPPIFPREEIVGERGSTSWSISYSTPQYPCMGISVVPIHPKTGEVAMRLHQHVTDACVKAIDYAQMCIGLCHLPFRIVWRNITLQKKFNHIYSEFTFSEGYF